MSKVYFKYGAMGSAKTALACINAFNYNEKGMHVLCLTSTLDTRSSLNGYFWKSRIQGLMREVVPLHPTDDIMNMQNVQINLYKVIIIDECQFLTKAQVESLFKISLMYNIPIICYGLLTDFKTELFEGSKRLIELGAKLEYIKSVDETGETSFVNARLNKGDIVVEGEQVLIGGNETYQSMSLKEYWTRQGIIRA